MWKGFNLKIGIDALRVALGLYADDVEEDASDDADEVTGRVLSCIRKGGVDFFNTPPPRPPAIVKIGTKNY